MNTSDWNSYFSASYADAKTRFLSAATARDAELSHYPIGDDANLTIDVAILGSPRADRTVVVSSGLHGVEGFFGSAVQLAWLDQKILVARHCRLVLVHAINPYGFANRRRCNEDNVDLNRNFCVNASDYRGSPPSYAKLDSLLNPPSAPSRFEPFTIKAIGKILSMGLPAIKQAVAGGQYDYRHGLFYGGSGPCESTRILQANYRRWIGDSPNVVHLDLHTGLGKYGQCKLLIDESASDPNYRWYTSVFGEHLIEGSSAQAATGTAYRASGALGGFLHHAAADRRFRFALAEFGTFGVLRVLAALRAENRAHFFARRDSRCLMKAKHELLECFCPANPRWRNQVVGRAINVIDSAINVTDRAINVTDGAINVTDGAIHANERDRVEPS